jgi:signal transduction histidine kinase
MLRTIGGRLFLSYLAVVAIGLVVAAVAIAGLLVRYEDDTLRLRLEELSAPLLVQVQNGVRDGKQPRDIIEVLADQMRSANARLLIINTQRRVLVDSDGGLQGQILARPASGNFGSFTDRGEQWLFVQQTLRPGAVAAAQMTAVVARPRAAFSDALRVLLPSLLVAAFVATGFALVVAGLLSRTITRPLRGLVAGARRFARGEYRARVPLAGPSEVATLSGAFNEMAAEIERARGSEQAFLADISHELRTPLTSIQGFAQAIAEGEAAGEAIPPSARIIQRESRRLVRMVEGLLELAKLQAGAEALTRERVEPAPLIAGAVEALEVQADEAQVKFDVETESLPQVSGDADKLAQLFLNLLDNAVKHSPRGSAISVRGARENGELVVRVRDAGSGLPDGAQSRLFRRFYRDSARRDSVGLGLAIASAIAQAHGGSISARNVEPGGAEFEVRLPVA